jgi:hypothetical protein
MDNPLAGRIEALDRLMQMLAEQADLAPFVGVDPDSGIDRGAPR